MQVVGKPSVGSTGSQQKTKIGKASKTIVAHRSEEGKPGEEVAIGHDHRSPLTPPRDLSRLTPLDFKPEAVWRRRHGRATEELVEDALRQPSRLAGHLHNW